MLEYPLNTYVRVKPDTNLHRIHKKRDKIWSWSSEHQTSRRGILQLQLKRWSMSLDKNLNKLVKE